MRTDDINVHNGLKGQKERKKEKNPDKSDMFSFLNYGSGIHPSSYGIGTVVLPGGKATGA